MNLTWTQLLPDLALDKNCGILVVGWAWLIPTKLCSNSRGEVWPTFLSGAWMVLTPPLLYWTVYDGWMHSLSWTPPMQNKWITTMGHSPVPSCGSIRDVVPFLKQVLFKLKTWTVWAIGIDINSTSHIMITVCLHGTHNKQLRKTKLFILRRNHL